MGWLGGILVLLFLIVVISFGLLLCFPALKKSSIITGYVCSLAVFGGACYQLRDIFDPKLFSTLSSVFLVLFGILNLVLIIRLRKAGLLAFAGACLLSLGTYFIIPQLNLLIKILFTVLVLGVIILYLITYDPNEPHESVEDDDSDSMINNFILYLILLAQEEDD